MTPRIFLDLDRTLFDTNRAGKEFNRAVGRLYGISEQTLEQDYEKFKSYIGDQYCYRIFDHLASYGVEPAEAATALHEALKDQDFLYPDARELLAYIKQQQIDATVLSFGDPASQGFKYRLVPELAGVPFISVLEPKGAYLAAHAPKASLIVDDKIITDVPPGCKIVQLTRTQAEPMLQQNGRTIVNDLRLLKELL